MSEFNQFQTLMILSKASLADLHQLVLDYKSVFLKPNFLLLKGEVGAGKTQFLKYLLGNDVASPTYAIHHSYSVVTESNEPLNIHHFDLYRLSDLDQLETTGFWDLIADSNSLVIVEWPDQVPTDWWPMDRDLYLLEIKKEVSDQLDQVSKDFEFRHLKLSRRLT